MVFDNRGCRRDHFYCHRPLLTGAVAGTRAGTPPAHAPQTKNAPTSRVAGRDFAAAGRGSPWPHASSSRFIAILRRMIYPCIFFSRIQTSSPSPSPIREGGPTHASTVCPSFFLTNKRRPGLAGRACQGGWGRRTGHEAGVILFIQVSG
jgi:hypothetical protein